MEGQKIDQPAPSAEQLQEVEGMVRNIFNQSTVSPQVDECITNTFQFFYDGLKKIENADDKEKATEQVSKAAVDKFVAWAQPFVDKWTADQEKQETTGGVKVMLEDLEGN